jgi:hypothetical protein
MSVILSNVIFFFIVQRPPVAPLQAWYFCSNGLKALNQTEIVILFEVKPKEDVFPEEVLRIFKVILDLVNQGTACCIVTPNCKIVVGFKMGINIEKSVWYKEQQT